MKARKIKIFNSIQLMSSYESKNKQLQLQYLQGLMTFTDTSFNSEQSQAVIVITNPIDVEFSKQPNAISAMKESDQIRVLVFRYFRTAFQFFF